MTRERLKRYLLATKQDLPKALHLYEQNIALSESLYGLLHWLEVAIRNAAHQALSAGFGTPAWYDQVQFSGHWLGEVQRAKRKTGGVPGKVVPELTLGFWVELTGKSHQNSLWLGNGLRHAFPHALARRDLIHDRLKIIQRLRNRMSHHERVLTSNNTFYAGFDCLRLPELVECVEWTCLETAQWMKAQQRYREACRILTEVNSMGIVL